MDRLTFSDERLMTLARGGDQQAFQALVRRFGAAMLTLASRMLGNDGAAEEAFVDSVAKLWLGRRTYRTGQPVRPWLLTITANTCRERFRAAHRLGLFQPMNDHLAVPSREPSNSDSAFIHDDNAARVQSALDRLPPRQRETLVLRIWGELEYEHIAAALEVTTETARSNMHHALASMRRFLGDIRGERTGAAAGPTPQTHPAASRPRSREQ